MSTLQSTAIIEADILAKIVPIIESWKYEIDWWFPSICGKPNAKRNFKKWRVVSNHGSRDIGFLVVLEIASSVRLITASSICIWEKSEREPIHDQSSETCAAGPSGGRRPLRCISKYGIDMSRNIPEWKYLCLCNSARRTRWEMWRGAWASSSSPLTRMVANSRNMMR